MCSNRIQSWNAYHHLKIHSPVIELASFTKLNKNCLTEHATNMDLTVGLFVVDILEQKLRNSSKVLPCHVGIMAPTVGFFVEGILDQKLKNSSKVLP